jgi:hypothetical protein
VTPAVPGPVVETINDGKRCRINSGRRVVRAADEARAFRFASGTGWKRRDGSTARMGPALQAGLLNRHTRRMIIARARKEALNRG